MLTRTCHDYKKPVFIVENLYIYGGAYSEIEYGDYDAIIRLLESPISEYKLHGTGIFKEFCSQRELNILHLPIPDREVPALSPKDWIELANFLLNTATNEKRFRIAIHCHGGHGRTGLVLAILGLIYKKLPRNPIKAIKKLREIYCEKAIESRSQLQYLLETGIKLKIVDILTDYTEYYKLVSKPIYAYDHGFIGMPRASKSYGHETNLWSTSIEEDLEENTEDIYIESDEPRCSNCIYFQQCFASEDSFPEDFDCQSFSPK